MESGKGKQLEGYHERPELSSNGTRIFKGFWALKVTSRGAEETADSTGSGHSDRSFQPENR